MQIESGRRSPYSPIPDHEALPLFASGCHATYDHHPSPAEISHPGGGYREFEDGSRDADGRGTGRSQRLRYGRDTTHLPFSSQASTYLPTCLCRHAKSVTRAAGPQIHARDAEQGPSRRHIPPRPALPGRPQRNASDLAIMMDAKLIKNFPLWRRGSSVSTYTSEGGRTYKQQTKQR